jgi:NADPH:quinone reductase-like Zn-dependent oxidoreductase/acyl carrier protein
VGDDVVAVAAGSFGRFVTTSARIVARRPVNLPTEDAAGVPITFLTAQYALQRLAGLGRGQRVLIHAAAGGVGLAAVQIAQRAQAEVYATASPGKWDFLRQLGVRHVMNSRTHDFAAELLAKTQEAGVDVVLNSLNGDFIPLSLAVLKQGGHFIEIGRRGIWEAERVAELRPDVHYVVLSLEDLCRHKGDEVQSVLGELMEAFESGALRPVHRQVFAMAEAHKAFRQMAQARHIGKIVLSRDQPIETTSPLEDIIRADGSYLITGGTGAIGLELAQWLASRGAGQVVLMGRRAAVSADRVIEELEKRGAIVRVMQGDVAKESDVQRVLSEIAATGLPLRGVFHAAGVLDDGTLLQQTWDKFDHVLAPKVAGAWNLHNATRDAALDLFVCFSSVAAWLGAPGQANYAAANAFLDALAAYRRDRGLPGLSIAWGPWSGGGMASSSMGQSQSGFAALLGSITPADGLQVLEQLLASVQSPPRLAVVAADWSGLVNTLFAGQAPPLLQELARPAEAVESVFLARLKSTAPVRRKGLLVAHVQEHAARILDRDIARSLDPRQPLQDVGFDSLMAVELRNALSTSLDCDLPATMLFKYPTIEGIAGYLGDEVLKLTAPPSVTKSEKTDDLDAAGEEQLAAMLAQEISSLRQEGGRP